MRRLRPRGLAAGAGLLAGMIALAACSDPRAGRADSPPTVSPAVPVSVATAVRRAVPVQVRAIGTVQPYTTVSIKAQINGQLMGVHFREGQDVRKGDLLFTIDPRPLQAALQQAEATVARDVAQARQAEANAARDLAQLDQARAGLTQAQAQLRQAEANLARDQAQLETARVQDARYAELVRQGYVAREQYDQVHTTLESMAATVRADQAMIENARAQVRAAEASVAQAQAAVGAGQAAIENAQAAVRADQAAADSARLQLAYTEIRSPIDGRTGNVLVQPGNLVKANDVPVLVTIAQVRPIYVAFSVPEQSLAEIRQSMAAGPLAADARPQGATRSTRGQVTFIDNTVDPSTGTIQLKATFPNQDGALWPGQFADVVLTLRTEPDALVVPSQAIQAGQQGPYVFVVRADLTVEQRPVVTARDFEGQTVVAKGLAPGERVVIDGQLRLAPGVKVEIKTGASSS
jgi:multidrug efflux system membrane fusion protein